MCIFYFDSFSIFSSPDSHVWYSDSNVPPEVARRNGSRTVAVQDRDVSDWTRRHEFLPSRCRHGTSQYSPSKEFIYCFSFRTSKSFQVLCEELEYSELIDKALATEEAHTRMVYVACFAASRYGSTAFRSGRKPFNPLLGQTFEFQCHHLGWKFVGEQVQHHPSVSACYAEGRDWRWWQDFETKVSYGGSSMEVTPLGVVYLNLPR